MSTANFNADGTATLETACNVCKKTKGVIVDAAKLKTWMDGEDHGHVQAYWPELSASDRELHFMSGICGDCWDELFGDGGDDDQD